MLYFIFSKCPGQLKNLKEVTGNHERAEEARAEGLRVQCRVDWKTYSEAQDIAYEASLLREECYLPVDNGEHHHPRYDVVRTPAKGDKVSYAFNGDYYPCGTVVKVSESRRRIETSDGRVFWRRGHTGTWLHERTWSLVQGHVNRRNPSF